MEPSEPNNLSSFKIFQRFHCFYYTKYQDQTLFLLHKKKNGFFSHFQGKLNELDPAIVFSIGRKLIRLSYGLFMKQNLNLFADDSISPENLKDIVQLCKPRLQIPKLSQCKMYQKFVEDSFDDMKPYQDESDAAYFFIEVPYINIEKFHNFCKEISLNLEVKFVSREDILRNQCGSIYEVLTKLFNPTFDTFVQNYIEKSLTPRTTGKYAILSIITTPTNYRTLGLLTSYFKKHGDVWKCYRFPVEKPTDEEILQLDGLFIPGASVCAADKTLPWRDQLLELIRNIYNSESKCKILGTCFGIQILAEAFQGKCGKMKEAKKGSSNLGIDPSFWKLPYVHELNIQPRDSLVIPKSHFDAVIEVPSIATVLATSDCCNVEIMTIGERCLAFQGHPEMNEAWTACLIYQSSQDKRNFKVYYEEVKKTYFKEKLEYELWLKIMFNFFKKKTEEEIPCCKNAGN